MHFTQYLEDKKEPWANSDFVRHLALLGLSTRAIQERTGLTTDYIRGIVRTETDDWKPLPLKEIRGNYRMYVIRACKALAIPKQAFCHYLEISSSTYRKLIERHLTPVDRGYWLAGWTTYQIITTNGESLNPQYFFIKPTDLHKMDRFRIIAGNKAEYEIDRTQLLNRFQLSDTQPY